MTFRAISARPIARHVIHTHYDPSFRYLSGVQYMAGPDAGRSREALKRTQEAWSGGGLHAVVATVAFGMVGRCRLTLSNPR